MAHLTVGEKAERVLKLLLGLRHGRVASALASRGFTNHDIDEGWALLRALSRGRLGVEQPTNMDPEALARLDAWENQWFPIADATLTRRFPAIRDKLFLNIHQTEGTAVILSVGTFLERFVELDKTADGAQAKKILESRGLTPAVIGEAQALLSGLATIEPMGSPVDPEQQKEEMAKAEQELWAWYLEWSRIARTSIKDRRLLRALGFLRVTASGMEIEEPELQETAATPNAPGLGVAPL